MEINPPRITNQVAIPAEPVRAFLPDNGYEWNNAPKQNRPPITYMNAELITSATLAIDPSPIITFNPVKYPMIAKIGIIIAAAATAVAPGLSTTALAFPRIVATMLVDAANTGNNPIVTRIAPIDCVKVSAWLDSERKNGGMVTNSKNMDAFVRLPDQIGCSVT